MKETIGLCICGSFCHHKEIENIIVELQEYYDVIPIVSNTVNTLSTRFFERDTFIQMLERTTKNSVVDTLVEAEKIQTFYHVHALVVYPCSATTLAKLSNGIYDTPVLLSIKGVLRNDGTIVLGISTNDGMMNSLENIGKLIKQKNIYFIPFFQDDYVNKPYSLSCDTNRMKETIQKALEGKQIQPILEEAK